MSTVYAPVEIPDWAWRLPETRALLRARDVPALFRFARKHGVTQGRISAATGMLQGRVSEIARGGRRVVSLEVFERIADGLAMPDDARMLLGLAPRDPGRLDVSLTALAEIGRVYATQAAAVPEIRRRVQAARRVELLAVRGLGIIGLNDSLLRSALVERARVEPVSLSVLMLDPDSGPARQRAREIGESHESFAGGIRLSLARLRELAAAPGVTVEVHAYAVLPVWRVIALDATLFVSAFLPDREGHEVAVYEIVATPTGTLHAGFRRVLSDVRAAAVRVI